jgi:hypothetical protein
VSVRAINLGGRVLTQRQLGVKWRTGVCLRFRDIQLLGTYSGSQDWGKLHIDNPPTSHPYPSG